MEQNKPQTEQELTQQAAVRRQKLADLCEANHGLWSAEAEEYLLKNWD